MPRDRFKNIMDLSKHHVSSSGDSALLSPSIAKATSLSVIYHFSCDKNIRKKCTVSKLL